MLKGDTVIGTWTRDVGECPIMVSGNWLAAKTQPFKGDGLIG